MNAHRTPRMSMLRAAAVALFGVLAISLLAACGSATGSSGGGQSRFIAGDGTSVLLPPAERQPAPAVTGTTLDGDPFDLASLKGKVVAVNVWASWCAPCRAEAPGLEEVATQMASQGVQFVGLNTRDSKASAQAFVSRFEISYPNVWDPDGQIQLQFRDTLPPQAIPSTLLIDKDNRVAGRILGKADRTQLRDLLTELMNEPGPSA